MKGLHKVKKIRFILKNQPHLPETSFVLAIISLVLVFAILNQRNVSSSSTGDVFLPLVLSNYQPPEELYSSTNLFGHSIFAECNPGGTSDCPCSEKEASIRTFPDHGEITSNPDLINTYINAIGYKKFTETYPNGQPIQLDTLEYSGFIRLPTIPKPNVMQINNPQAIHFMVQLWDGRNSLFQADRYTQEGVLYWDLNPWVTSDYGKIKIYTKSLFLIDTGINIKPDTNWHSFDLIIDLRTQKYISATIDGKYIDLSAFELARVSHSDWGDDLSLSITTESMASWPGESCNYVFTWTTQFKNLTLKKIN